METIRKINSSLGNKIDYKNLTQALSTKLPQYSGAITEAIMPALIGKKGIAQICQHLEGLNESDLEIIGIELVHYLKSQISIVNNEIKNQIIENYSSLAGQIIREKNYSSSPSSTNDIPQDFVESMVQKKILAMVDKMIDSRVEEAIRSKIQVIIKRIMIEEIQKL